MNAVTCTDGCFYLHTQAMPLALVSVAISITTCTHECTSATLH